MNHRVVIREAVLRNGCLISLILSFMVGVVVDLGVAEVGDDDVSIACKEEISEGDSMVEDTHFVDRANGNKLDVARNSETKQE